MELFVGTVYIWRLANKRVHICVGLRVYIQELLM